MQGITTEHPEYYGDWLKFLKDTIFEQKDPYKKQFTDSDSENSTNTNKVHGF